MSIADQPGVRVGVSAAIGLDEVDRGLDARRILWAAGDLVENRPALSRWSSDHAEAFAAFIRRD